MKLYHHPMSSNARRVRMTAILLDLPLDLELVDIASGGGQDADYLSVNPNGKVPTLVDGDMVLWESHAIMTYLADKKPSNTLYPTELAKRARVNQWLFWVSSHFSASTGMLVNQKFLKQMMGRGPADPSIVQLAETEFTRCCRVLDAHFAKNKYLCGDAMTLADVSLSAPLMYVTPAKLPIEGHANLNAWLSRMQDTDAWKQTG